MSKIILIALALLLSLHSVGQTIGYTYKPLVADGFSVRHGVTNQDNAYVKILNVK